jgi:thiol-disulfide isomerase/thioredoxin
LTRSLRSRLGSASLDVATGLVALGLSAPTILVQPLWPFGFDYLLLGVPALLFPLATDLRAGRGAGPRWATLLLVNASLALGVGLLSHAAGASVTTLLPVAAVVLAGSAIAALTRGLDWPRTRRVGLVLPSLVALALVPKTMSSWLVRPASQAAAPDVTLRMLDGQEMGLASLRGRVVVLNFWGLYCDPCVRELPELETVARAYRGNAGVAFVAVEVGQGKDREAVRCFAAQHGLELPVAYDADQRIQRALGVLGTPTTLLIDPAGVVRHRRVGYAVAADYGGWLSGRIEELLPRT